MNSPKRRSKSAFSLIEVTVVLLIIGILIAGVFVANSMVKKFRMPLKI